MKSKLKIEEFSPIELEEVKTINPYVEEGYVIKHTVDVHVPYEDPRDVSLMLFVFNAVIAIYDSPKHHYIYRFAKVSKRRSGTYSYFRVLVSDKK